ncbi:uncharacterized protein BT62DRAFT_21490 [Guyanagaster necrorhizus]|uniref:Uncharacterized protein n=1 Tax=Guyanagaster necrorhizus TaxID=856835 RepID=A0A9P8B061_9AGAR|nr:uncharacterized protein BT62DRAFT_21490 [Guyanagaster necrorhizus MCA 3950]KAG7452707.1 hypothetical protein BT62DRAFT_21490 [Guyanagaster necrorhizus MCA 3950]
MIDLTLDDSPPSITKRSKDKQRQNPAHVFTFDADQLVSLNSDGSIAKKSIKSLDVSSKVLATSLRTTEEAANESTTPSPTDPQNRPAETRNRTEKPVASRQVSVRQQQPVRTSDSIFNLDCDPAMVHTAVTKPDASLDVLPSTLPSSAKGPACLSSRLHNNAGNADPTNRTGRQETPISLSDRNQSLLVKENSSTGTKQKFDIPLRTISSRGTPLFDKTNSLEFSFRTEQYSPPNVISKSSKHGMLCCLSIPAV